MRGDVVGRGERGGDAEEERAGVVDARSTSGRAGETSSVVSDGVAGRAVGGVGEDGCVGVGVGGVRLGL